MNFSTEQLRAEFEEWFAKEVAAALDERRPVMGGYSHQRCWEAWQAARAAQATEQAEVLKDAERYRWLRGNRDAQLPNGCITDIYDSDGAVLFYEELDDAIDAAMAAAQGEGRTGA